MKLFPAIILALFLCGCAANKRSAEQTRTHAAATRSIASSAQDSMLRESLAWRFEHLDSLTMEFAADSAKTSEGSIVYSPSIKCVKRGINKAVGRAAKGEATHTEQVAETTRKQADGSTDKAQGTSAGIPWGQCAAIVFLCMLASIVLRYLRNL